MKRELMAALLLSGLCSVAVAEVRQSHRCERNGIERNVQLTSDNNSGVPCAVVYEKPMEDQSITNLWTAQNDADFCRQKYDSFIIKLESTLDWSCTADSALDAALDAEVSQEGPALEVTKPEIERPAITEPATAKTDIVRSDVTAAETIIPKTAALEKSLPKNLQPKLPIKKLPPATLPEPTNTQTDEQQQRITVQESVREATLTPSTEEQGSAAPSVPAALPRISVSEQRDEFGLDLIRNVFPTGYYRQATDQPHTGDTTLCPADGFFIWNTQQTDVPAFEMGPQTSFVFNLKQFIEQPRAINTGDIGTEQCDYNVQSSYCINNRQKEDTLISSRSADSVSCSPGVTGSGPVRALALITNSISYTIPQACQADAPPTSMAMATFPPTSLSGTGQTGFELAIEKNVGSSVRSANCHYTKGQ